MAAFFQRNLPPGWTFAPTSNELVLKRQAPVYALQIDAIDFQTMGKNRLLEQAHKKGRKINCSIAFKLERHDDIALVRQKVRLYKEIRADIVKAYDRLRLRHVCRGISLQECAEKPGAAGEAAKEYLTTRNILADKLEVTPIYRIGTLYLYPQRNQCVPASIDWYVTNTLLPEGLRILPFEAGEEIEIIFRNMEQLKLWE